MNPWEFINSLNNKTDLMTAENEGSYPPFIVNRSFSYFPDTVLYANELNTRSIPSNQQHKYLLGSITKRKRFSKWAKTIKSTSLEAIMEYYGYSLRKALQTMDLLTTDQIREIEKKLEKTDAINRQNWR